MMEGDVKVWLALFCVAACTTAVAASEIDINVDNFFVKDGIATAVMKVTNGTRQDYSSVYIDCAFLGADKQAMDIGKALITDFAAGATRYDKASAVTGSGVQFASCQVVQTN